MRRFALFDGKRDAIQLIQGGLIDMRLPWQRTASKLEAIRKAERENSSRDFLPAEVRENAPDPKGSEKKFTAWVDSAWQEFVRGGGLDDLPGKGKPLSIDPDADVFTSVLKNARVLPPWLELQHEIRDALRSLQTSIETGVPVEVETEVARINQLIRKYNSKCPSPVLQKGFVTEKTIAAHVDRWS